MPSDWNRPFEWGEFLRYVQARRNWAAKEMHNSSITQEERKEAAILFNRGGITLAAGLPGLD